MADFNLIVIGGGSGGVAAARRAAEHGAKVLLCDPNPLGGTCVNRGCVPKKVMWNASQVVEAVNIAGDYGVTGIGDARGFDWAQLKTARDDYVARLNGIYTDNLNASGVTVLKDTATFCAPNTVEIAGKQYSAEHILIAAGGQPTMPNLPGAELAITSDGFFELDAQPQRPLIIGAGYIATELAGLLHGIGSQVTMLLRKDRLLRAFDFALGEMVFAQMQDGGVDIRINTQAEELFRADDGSLGYRAGGESCAGFDCVIVAISRHPNTADLNLPAANLAPDARGFIPVDEFQNTATANIYAVGDITPAAPLTPVAIKASRHLADRLFGNRPDAKMDYSNIPTVVFSHPPIGSVGLGYEAAVETYGADAVKVYESRFVNMRYAVGAHKPASLVKLITSGADERVVGCHIVGDGADEMVQGFAVAVKMGATKADFDATVAVHPTAGEELVLLR